ncbi:MAG TPA: ATP-binding protein, partial [Myxococcota bacterium]|nr:ATP-binding protein [Myxococcota bacterium]
GGAQRWGGGTLALLVASPLPPLYLLTIALHTRVAALEKNPTLGAAVCAPFVALAALIATNDFHHLVLRGAPRPLRPPSEWAGPGFWAFEAWVYAYFFLGLGLLARTLALGPTRDDRQRALLIVAATVLPLAAHTAHLAGWLPLGYPVTPGALGLTALLVVVGIDRFALLEAQPVVQRDVVEQLHDGLVLADPGGIVIDANRAGERLVGAPREALRGRRLDEILCDLGGDDALRSVPLSDGAEVELPTLDGRRLEVRAGAVHAHAGQPAGRFLVLRDRTDQWRQERTLQQRQRLESVGVLAAGVAHEVNNPLAFVRANLVHLQELAARLPKLVKPDADEDARELLELPEVLGESLHGLDRIGRIVESLLRFARPPSDRRREVSLNQVAAEALRFAALHRGRTVRVDTAFDPALPTVEASEERLVQVALNLILNAKQALAERPDGAIRLETSREGESVVLRVRDNGPGVPPALRERIFDPFFTTREPGEGTGLGLAIAFDILREHEGALELESPPAGACFAVRLPLRRAPRTPADPGRAPARPTAPRP